MLCFAFKPVKYYFEYTFWALHVLAMLNHGTSLFSSPPEPKGNINDGEKGSIKQTTGADKQGVSRGVDLSVLTFVNLLSGSKNSAERGLQEFLCSSETCRSAAVCCRGHYL